ncbi:relaxase/mobilization nuclease domain-containing protein [Actinomadura sp. 3N407]|uniref:relaxase/mobilization nuclease domain-containing protein n=1 Tax=Actinomadura sp. 3N407 TaxID=3457423 RepID=UPI003FCCB9EE
MNNKIMKRGRDVAGLVRYLFGKGEGNEHTGQRVIAAAAALDIADGTRLDRRQDWPRVLDLARHVDAHRRLAGVAPADGWVWHCAISLPPGEHLDDAQWANVARTAMQRLGFEADEQGGRAGCRWIAVHHGPSAGGNDHIHLAVNLVRDDLTIAAPGRDRIAMSRLCGDMERRYGLHVVEGRPGRGMPGYTRAAKERAERTQRRTQTPRKHGQDVRQDAGHNVGQDAGRAVPETATLARKIRAAATAATGEAEFVQAALDAGVWVRPRYGKGGDRSQVVGYSAALPGSGTGAAGPIWYGGGKLAADLSLPRLRARWTTAPKTTPPGALPTWQHANDLATGPGGTGAGTRVDAAPSAGEPTGEPAGRDARQWRQAARRAGAAAHALRDLPPGDPAGWAAVASDTAGLLSLLADRVDDDELAAELAAAGYSLAWSAQTPRDHRGTGRRGDHRADHRAPARSDLAEVARVVRVASRARAEDAAVAVAIAALVLALLAVVRLIQAWHDHQQHRRQAATLDAGYRRCQLAARAHTGNAAAPWHRRPHGAVGDAALRRQADSAEAELARFVEVEGRAVVLLQQARAGDGPAASRLRERAAALAAAAAAETELPAARDRVAAARADQDAARTRLAELAPLADLGRLALRAHGTSRAQLARDQAAARDQLTATTTAEQTARTRLADLTRQAAAPITSDHGRPARPAWRDGAATAEHTDLTTNWPERLAAAIADDVDTAPDRAAGLTAETRAAVRATRRIVHATTRLSGPATTADARERLAALRTEQAIRATLPPDRADHEQQQRRQHATAQRATRPAARPAAAPYDPHRHGPHHDPGRGQGPGLGR